VNLFFCGAVKTALEHEAWPGEIAWGTVGALRDRVLAGERPGVIIVSDAALDQLADHGLLVPGTRLSMGETATGFAIRNGAKRRPIGNANELRTALLTCESIAWADGSSGATAGKHFEAVVAQLGIMAELLPKATLVHFGVEAVAACSRGEVELAVSQSTEIVGRPGVSLLGPFPAPFALSTGYSAAIVEDSAAARGVMARLATPATRVALDAIGFTKP
jgi:molybdate transport system substrate-binding protein